MHLTKRRTPRLLYLRVIVSFRATIVTKDDDELSVVHRYSDGEEETIASYLPSVELTCSLMGRVKVYLILMHQFKGGIGALHSFRPFW